MALSEAAAAAAAGAANAVSKNFKLNITFVGSKKTPGCPTTSERSSSSTSLIEFSIKKRRPCSPFNWRDEVVRPDGPGPAHQPIRGAPPAHASSSNLAYLYLLMCCFVFSGLIGAFGELLDAAVPLFVASDPYK